MSAFQINGLHGNASLLRSELETSELHVVPGSDWHVNQAGSEGNSSPCLIGFLAAWHSDTGSPLNVIITGSNPLTPQWGSFLFLSSFSPVSNQPLLVLPLFDSLWLYLSQSLSSLSPSVTKMSISGAEGCLLRAKRDTVIKLSGLNMTLSGIFIKPVHQGRPRVTQPGGSQH